jgi:hypothetical protein
MPEPIAPDTTLLKIRLPLVVEFVIVLDEAPRSTVPEKVVAPVPDRLKFPPMVMLFVNALVPVVLNVPPVNVSIPVPKAASIVGVTVEELSVKPPEKVLIPESVSEPAPAPLRESSY